MFQSCRLSNEESCGIVEYFLFNQEKKQSDLDYLLTIEETILSKFGTVFHDRYECSRKLLLNCHPNTILILFIDNMDEAEFFLSIKNLISDIPILIALKKDDPILKKVCLKLRPKFICDNDNDTENFILIIEKISNPGLPI